MRVTYFALCAAALVGPVAATLSLGPEGQISSVNDYSKLKEYGQASMKEICYRNLYADLNAFQVKNTKELLVSDSKGATVFLSQGILRNEDDVEMLYEEFCYKQYRVDEHKSDVQALSGIHVGKRDLINTLGLSSLDAFKGFSPGADSGPTHDGTSPLFAKGSFLDSFATHSPTDDDAFYSGTDATAFGGDSLNKDSVDGVTGKPDEGKADKGGELPKDDHFASRRSPTRRGTARPRLPTARVSVRGPGGGSSCARKRGLDSDVSSFSSPSLLPFSFLPL